MRAGSGSRVATVVHRTTVHGFHGHHLRGPTEDSAWMAGSDRLERERVRAETGSGSDYSKGKPVL
jgi:hypothetical protein